MAAMNWLVARYELKLLRTGEYGTPPSWRPWLAQLLVWGALGVGEKLLTTFALVVPFRGDLGVLQGGPMERGDRAARRDGERRRACGAGAAS